MPPCEPFPRTWPPWWSRWPTSRWWARNAVARLIAAYRSGATVAVAAYEGKPRNPVLLAREHWPEVIATATGDQGARAFLRARPDLVTLIECGDTGRPDDIDTTADLDRIADRHRAYKHSR